MTIKFEKIHAGQTLYDVRRAPFPRSMYGKWEHWPVLIVSVDAEKRTAVVSWNHNREQVYGERSLTRLRAKPPERKP